MGLKLAGPTGQFRIEAFFDDAATTDALDALTIVDQLLKGFSAQEGWRDVVRRIFSEENLAYRFGDDGVVHPFIDPEFEVNRASAISALSDDRFAEARTDFEAAYRHLRNGEGKQAVRMMFPAVEVATKVLFPGAIARLMPNEIERFIIPKLQMRYYGNEPALEAGKQLLTGFKAWIVASQPYRHGQEVQEPQEPPTDFLVAYLSAGASYLRWMIELCA